MRSKTEVLENIISGLEEGRVRYAETDEEIPILVAKYENECRQFTGELIKWRDLKLKAKADNASDELKKLAAQATVRLYFEVMHKLSLGHLILNKDQDYEKTIVIMEQRIHGLEAEVTKCKDENKQLAKQLAKYKDNELSEGSPPPTEYRGTM